VLWYCISIKHFRPGGMAPSEWTRSVRAVRYFLVVPHSSLGADTTCRIAYRPPITVSQFLLALFVSYLKPPLRRCGQLWPLIGMSSLRTRLNQDCNVMGDAAKTAPHVPSTCAQNPILALLILHIIPSRQICVAVDDPSLVPSVSCHTTYSYLWNYVRAADDVNHAGNLQGQSYQCFSHLNKFRDGIQVTRVFRYCVECQG